MKYDITYSCGHKGTVYICGKSDRRERKLKYFQEYVLCPECYKKEKETEFLEKKSKYSALPELTGTPKQIAWAEKIRIKAIDRFKLDEFAQSSKKITALNEKIEKAKLSPNAETSYGKWWIKDNSQKLRILTDPSAKYFIEGWGDYL